MMTRCSHSEELIQKEIVCSSLRQDIFHGDKTEMKTLENLMGPTQRRHTCTSDRSVVFGGLSATRPFEGKSQRPHNRSG